MKIDLQFNIGYKLVKFNIHTYVFTDILSY